VAMAEVVKSVLWLRNLMIELILPDEKQPKFGDEKDVHLKSDVFIYTDNRGAEITVRSGDTSGSKLKHVEIRYHFIRAGQIETKYQVKWIPTHKQLADILTKNTSRPILENLRNKVMGNYIHDERVEN